MAGPAVAAPAVPAPAVAAPAGAPPPSTAALAPGTAKVPVRSDPPGADVLLDGISIGVTPALVSVPLPCELTLELPGYRSERVVLSTAEDVAVKLTRHHSSKPKASGHQSLD
jgi:hypothetical protein